MGPPYPRLSSEQPLPVQAILGVHENRATPERWQGRYHALTDWVEEHIEETFTFYRLPLAHHKHMKSTNMLERFNGELRRRTRVIRIFPNPASCLRLIRALAVETHEGWLEDNRYLNMEYWQEHRRQVLHQAA